MLLRQAALLIAPLAALHAPLAAAESSVATSLSGIAGADYWRIESASGTARYLPDYSLPGGRALSHPSLFARVDASAQQMTAIGPVTLTASASHHSATGSRIDRLDLDWRATNHIGVRAGILPYRVSWCRALGDGSWMAEPDVYCRFHGQREVAQGGFGAQAYATGAVGGWLLDGMAGVYRPMLLQQADKLGPYVPVGPTVAHRKHGASVNAMHLASGLQMRAGWLRTAQDQDSAAGSYQRRMRYDMTYLAAEYPVGPVTLRASLSINAGDQVNPANQYGWLGRSRTVEAAWRTQSAGTIAFGVSDYSNRTLYARPPNNQLLHVPSISIAWRHDLRDDWSVSAQATRTIDDATTRSGVRTERAGNAYGARFAKTF